MRGFSALVVVNDETAPRCSSLPLSPSATVTNSATESRAGASSRCSSDSQTFHPKYEFRWLPRTNPASPQNPEAKFGIRKFWGQKNILFSGMEQFTPPPLALPLLPMGGQTGKRPELDGSDGEIMETNALDEPAHLGARPGRTEREREAEDVGLECCSPRRRRRRP